MFSIFNSFVSTEDSEPDTEQTEQKTQLIQQTEQHVFYATGVPIRVSEDWDTWGSGSYVYFSPRKDIKTSEYRDSFDALPEKIRIFPSLQDAINFADAGRRYKRTFETSPDPYVPPESYCDTMNCDYHAAVFEVQYLEINPTELTWQSEAVTLDDRITVQVKYANVAQQDVFPLTASLHVLDSDKRLMWTRVVLHDQHSKPDQYSKQQNAFIFQQLTLIKNLIGKHTFKKDKTLSWFNTTTITLDNNTKKTVSIETATIWKAVNTLLTQENILHTNPQLLKNFILTVHKSLRDKQTEMKKNGSFQSERSKDLVTLYQTIFTAMAAIAHCVYYPISCDLTSIPSQYLLDFLAIASLQVVPVPVKSDNTKQSSTNIVLKRTLIGQDVIGDYLKPYPINTNSVDAGSIFYVEHMKHLVLLQDEQSVSLFHIITDLLKEFIQDSNQSMYAINVVSDNNGNMALTLYKLLIPITKTILPIASLSHIDIDSNSFPLPLCYLPLNPRNADGIRILQRKGMFQFPQLNKILGVKPKSKNAPNWQIINTRFTQALFNLHLDHYSPTQGRLIAANKGVLWLCFSSSLFYNRIKPHYQTSEKALKKPNLKTDLCTLTESEKSELTTLDTSQTLPSDLMYLIFYFAFDPQFSLSTMEELDQTFNTTNTDTEQHWTAALFKSVIMGEPPINTLPIQSTNLMSAT